MLYRGLWEQSDNYLDFIKRQIGLGLDVVVQIPPRQPGLTNDYYNLHGLPVEHHPEVKISEWIEHPNDEQYPIMVKEYNTPDGVLRTEVRQTPDWRWGDHVPFLDDYLVSRSRKFLVEDSQDLPAFRYLLGEQSSEARKQFILESRPVLDYARQSNLLVAGGWGVTADLIGWVYGLQNMVFAVYDQPDFIRELLDIIAAWNQNRMEGLLQSGIDLYVKRAWYENCDFWTPDAYQEFIAPIVKADVELAHQYGAKFGYIITSNCMPLLDIFAQIGIDVIIGVDPANWDLEKCKEKLGGRVCLWGGVNGHLTLERGDEETIRAEVHRAMYTLAPEGGFILSPVDNIREFTPEIQRNVKILIDEWKHHNGV